MSTKIIGLIGVVGLFVIAICGCATTELKADLPPVRIDHEFGYPMPRETNTIGTALSRSMTSDERIYREIKRSWRSLLENRHFAGEQTGAVIIQFCLNGDGTISQVQELGSQVDSVLSLLCRMAIEQPAPYEPTHTPPRTLTLKFVYR